MPSPVRTRVPRRPVLLAGAAAAAAPALSSLLAGCVERPPDPLIALLVQARADASLAAAVAETAAVAEGAGSAAPKPGGTGAGPPPTARAALLSELAAARRTHADALSRELGDDAPPLDAGSTPAPSGGLGALTAALADAQRRATEVVPGLSRSRAALVGSIAACCGAYRSVLS